MCAAARDDRHGLKDDVLITLLYDTRSWRVELLQVDRAMVGIKGGDLRIPRRIQKNYPKKHTPIDGIFAARSAARINPGGNRAERNLYWVGSENASRACWRATSGWRGADPRVLRQLLIGLSTGYLAIQLGRNILSPLLPAIVEDLAISPFRAGIAISVLSAAYALCMYPGGRLSDRLTRKTVLVAAALLTALGFGALAVTGSYPTLLVGAATAGLGAGLYWIALRGLLADLFVDRRGQAFGIQDALGFVGPIIAAGGAVAVLAVADWRLAFPPLVAFLLAAATFAHYRIDEPYELARVGFDFVATGRRVFGDRQVRWLVVGYTCGIFVMQAVIGFLPLFLQSERGLPSAYASAGFAILFLGAVVTMPTSGYLGDRFSHVPVAVGGLCLSILGLLGFVYGPSPAIIGAGILCFGLGIWAFPPVIQAYLMTRFPNESMGGDFGAFKTVYAGVGSLGPAYVGFAAGAVGYTPAFLGLIGLLVAAVIVFLCV